MVASAKILSALKDFIPDLKKNTSDEADGATDANNPKPSETPVTAAASSSQGGNVNAQMARSLPSEAAQQELEKPKDIVQERIRAAQLEARNQAHTLGLGAEETAEAINAAGVAAEHKRGAFDVKKEVTNVIAKVSGIPLEILNAAQEMAKSVQLACAGASRESLCTLPPALSNLTQQQSRSADLVHS